MEGFSALCDRDSISQPHETAYFMREATGLITGAAPLAECSIVKVLLVIVSPMDRVRWAVVV